MKSIAMIFCLTMAAASLYAQNKKEPPPPPPPLRVEERMPMIEKIKFEPPADVIEMGLQDFYKRNKSASSISWRSEHQVKLVFKDPGKQQEDYNLADKVQAEVFRKTYGEAPKKIVPPPPLPIKKE